MVATGAVVEAHVVEIDPTVHRRRRWILAVLCVSLLIVGIGGTIVNVALLQHFYWGSIFLLNIPVRGELPAGTDHETLADLLVAPLYSRALVGGEPITSETAHRIVTAVLGTEAG